MPPYVFKPKTENKNVTRDYMIWTGKNVQNHFTSSKKKSKSKFFTFLFEEIYCVCQFLYFYNFLFAFIHYTFCFNSINMGFCWIFRSFNSMRLADSLFKVSCNFSSTTFSDFNSLISFVRASPFLVLASEASFSFLSARNLQ